jgi:aminopeptidase-like protein
VARRDILSKLLASGDGETMYALIEELYPVCRSITGEGVRKTLGRVAEELPLELHEVPSGTPVFDWTVPKEWNIREAWIKGPDGKKIIDFGEHNLHVVNYSVPVHEHLALEELQPKLHSLPDRPDWIPYRTSYYDETWGFCLTHNARSRTRYSCRRISAIPRSQMTTFPAFRFSRGWARR